MLKLEFENDIKNPLSNNSYILALFYYKLVTIRKITF